MKAQPQARTETVCFDHDALIALKALAVALKADKLRDPTRPFSEGIGFYEADGFDGVDVYGAVTNGHFAVRIRIGVVERFGALVGKVIQAKPFASMKIPKDTGGNWNLTLDFDAATLVLPGGSKVAEVIRNRFPNVAHVMKPLSNHDGRGMFGVNCNYLAAVQAAGEVLAPKSTAMGCRLYMSSNSGEPIHVKHFGDASGRFNLLGAVMPVRIAQ